MTDDTRETEAAPQADPEIDPPGAESKPGAEPQSTAGPQPAASPVSRVQYLRSFGFVFRSPKWGMNLLLGSVCMFIPTIGQILLFGYLYEIVESLHRGRRDGYPDFDFKRFTPYLNAACGRG